MKKKSRIILNEKDGFYEKAVAQWKDLEVSDNMAARIEGDAATSLVAYFRNLDAFRARSLSNSGRKVLR